MYAMGTKINKIIPITIAYLKNTVFSRLNLTKNIIVNGINNTKPSYLIKAKMEANPNAQ